MTAAEVQQGVYWPQQSPINITRSYHARELPPLDFTRYPDVLKGEVTGTGHGLNIQPKAETPAALGFDGRTCPLLKYHLHARSEHRLNGADFPLEIHFVHQLDPGHGSKYVVVGVFLERADDAPANESLRLLGEALKGFAPPAEWRWADAGPRGVEVTIRPALFWPADRGYFRYEGSLTTPEYDEAVSWVVLKTPVPVRPADIDPVIEHAKHEARPPQALNRRFVLRSFP